MFGSIYSKQVFFAIDMSESMHNKIHLTESEARTGAAPSDLFRTKADYIIHQLKRSIQNEVEENAEFNMCMFAVRPVLWHDSAKTAKKENKDLACSYLDDLPGLAEGGTNLEKMFTALFDQADKGFDRRTNKSVYDQIYLVTDGMPTLGETNRRTLLDTIRFRNRQHHIRIDTIVVEAIATHVAFLKQLAAENFGKCTIVNIPHRVIQQETKR